MRAHTHTHTLTVNPSARVEEVKQSLPLICHSKFQTIFFLTAGQSVNSRDCFLLKPLLCKGCCVFPPWSGRLGCSFMHVWNTRSTPENRWKCRNSVTGTGPAPGLVTGCSARRAFIHASLRNQINEAAPALVVQPFIPRISGPFSKESSDCTPSQTQKAGGSMTKQSFLLHFSKSMHG